MCKVILFHMNELPNIHCLGCKTRHETVVVDQIKEMLVKGSPRYQAKGICPEGKTWTKILNKNERSILSHMMPVSGQENKNEIVSVVSAEKSVKIDTTGTVKQNAVKNDAPKQKTASDEPFDSNDDVAKNQKQEELLALFETDEDLLSTPSIAPQQGHVEMVEAEIQKPNPVEDDNSNRRELMDEVSQLRTDLRGLHKPTPPAEPFLRLNPATRTPSNRTQYISGEQAYKYGKHYGYNEATFSHERYREGLSHHFKQSKISPRFFDAFNQGYIEGGERFLLSAQDNSPIIAPMGDDSAISPKTTAGLAAVSIFGAWVASKVGNRR
jgi:hypothetical protein